VSAPARQKPNPGSDEALSMGCICPVLDNGHGRMPPYPPSGWWVTEGCPLHAPTEPRVRRIETARQEAGTE
jgi:hypothetical protein